MLFKTWYSALTPSRRRPIRRRQLILEELEARLAPATFAEAGSILNLDLNVANKSVSIVSAGSSYSMTLTGDTWSGTNSANVMGNGTSVLTVTAAGLAAFNTFNLTDSAAGGSVTFASSGGNAYSDNFNVTLDSSPAATAVQFTGSSSFTSTNSLNVSTTQNIAFAAGSTLTMATGADTLSASTLSIAGVLQASGATTFNVVDVTSAAGATISTGTGLTVNNSGTASTLAGNITGAGGLIKNGAGTLTFTGTKTYGGATTISAGTLRLGDGVTDGSVLSGVVDNATLNFNNVNPLTYGGTISGTGAVTKTGGGILTLSGQNGYTGATTISGGSTIRLGSSGAASPNSTITGAGTLDLNSLLATIGGLQGATVTNNAAGAGTATLLVSSTVTFNGVIQDGPTAHTSVAVSGPPGVTLTLAGTNTYTGITSVAPNNTLKAGSSNGTSPNSVVQLNSASTFDLNGFSTAVAGVVGGGGTLTNNGAIAAALTVTGANGGSIATKIVNGASATGLTIGGPSGTTVTMTTGNAPSTYSGATTINSGNTLRVGSSGPMSANSTVTGAGTLDLNSLLASIGGLQGATVTNNAAGAGTATLLVSVSATFNGTIQDGATAHTSVAVSGPAGVTLTLAGTNTYTGVTSVGPSNTLKAGSNNGTSPNSVVQLNSVSTFDLNGFNTSAAGVVGGAGIVTNNDGTAAALTITGANGGSISSRFVNGAATTGLTIGGPSGTIVTMFAGNGPSTYSGATTINGGNTLRVGSSGVTSGNSTVTGAGTLDLNSLLAGIGGLQGATVTNNAGGTGTGILLAPVTATFNGIIKDGATAHTSVAVSAPPGVTLTLAGTNTYTGVTSLATNNILKAGSVNGTSPNSVVQLNNAGTLDLNGFNTTVAGVVGVVGTVTNSGASAAALTVTGANGGSIAIKIVDGASTTGLTIGGATVTMSAGNGPSTYSGATTINSGNTLKLGGSGVTSANSTVTGAGTLDLNGQLAGIGGLQGATITNNAGGTGTALLLAPVTAIFNGIIKDGATAHTSVGTSGPAGTTLTLAGVNTYTGVTSLGINNTLKVGSTNGTSPNSVVQLNNVGTLDLNGFNTIVAGVVGPSGNVTNSGATAAALTVTGANGGSIATKIVDGASVTGLTIGGLSGTIVSMTPGNGPSTYSGATTINSGNTLKVNGIVTSANSTVTGAGTLDLNNNFTAIGGLQGATVTNNAIGGATAVLLAAATASFNGVITDGATAHVAVNVSGPAGTTLTLAGTNTYTGATSLNPNNTLKVGTTNGTSANSVVQTNGPSTLDLNGFNTAVAGLTGIGSVVLGNQTLTVGDTNTSSLFGGSISGAGGLTKVGIGTLTLTGANTYGGTTTINNGTLQIGAGGPSGSLGTGAIVDNSLLVFTLSSSPTISTSISGAGSLTQSGAGTTTLTGANTYTGITTVSSGNLRVDGSIADGPAAFDVSVGSGATLSGTGTVPSVLVLGAGTIEPGDSPGVLHTGAVTFAVGSQFLVEINGTSVGTQYDQLNSTGVVSLGNANLTLSLGFTSAFGDVFTIVSAASVLGTFNGLGDGGSVTVNSRELRINYTSTTVTLTDITNTPPEIASDVASVSADEGGVATNTGTFSDAQGNATVTVTASVGTVTQDNVNGTWSWSIAAADGPAGPFTVTITATDDHNAAATSTFTYAINNVPPTISLSGNATVDEGAVYTLNLGVVTDPGQDTITSYKINWGDGVIDTFTGNPANSTATHIFADGPSNQTDNVIVTDEDGTFLAGSLSVQVLNVAPTATFSNGGAVAEESAGAVSFSNQFDPSAADSDFHYAYDFDNDGTFDSGDGTYAGSTADGASVTIPASYFADGPGTRIVLGRIIDKDGGFTDYTTTITINNVPPVFTSLQVDNAVINMGETATLSGTFTDPGVFDTHTVVVSWGDGSADTTLNLSANVLSFSAPHQYVNTQAGNPAYTISVTVTDKDAGSATATTSITVLSSVYVLNPNAAGALSLTGNSSIHVAGLVDVDSNSATALQAGGNSAISAGSILVTGGVQQTGNATLSTTVTGAPVANDPLAFLTPPTLADLGLTSMPTPTSVSISGNTMLTIDPGVYSQIKVSGNAQLFLNPGIYVLAGGGLTVTGNGSISGDGVMIYNAGSNYVSVTGTPSFGGLTLSGNGAIELTPIADGKFAGILIFQARDNTRAMSLSGNSLTMQGGAIYAQQALLAISGNADIQGSLVVNQLHLTGNAASALDVEGVGPTLADTAGQLLAGDLVVYVDNSAGQFTDEELARIADAIDAINIVINPYGVAISTVSAADRDLATTVLQISNTSAVGGAVDGVLGCESPGNVTIVSGWDWYTQSDSRAVGAGQYDFQTIVTHELGHALGLGHSAESGSVMNATLATGEAHRVLSAADLAIPDVGEVACGLHVATSTASEHAALVTPNLAGPAVTSELLALPLSGLAMVSTSPREGRVSWDAFTTAQPYAPTLLPVGNGLADDYAALDTALTEFVANAADRDGPNSATSDEAQVESLEGSEVSFGETGGNLFSSDGPAAPAD